MNVVGSSNRRVKSSIDRLSIQSKGGAKLTTTSASSSLELNFYATPPNYELTLDEFEELALARLKVSES